MEQVADFDDEVMEKFLEGGATGVDVVSTQLLLHAIRRYAEKGLMEKAAWI